MARTDTLGHFLTDVADAIRTKTGSSETIVASDFDTEIENIPSGGTTPTGTITITENGTNDVTDYASAVVNVPVVPTQYVIADSSTFTLSSANWELDIYTLIIDATAYTINSQNVAIGIPATSSSTNCINVVKAGLVITSVTSSNITIVATNVPTVDIQVAIFGVTATQ